MNSKQFLTNLGKKTFQQQTRKYSVNGGNMKNAGKVGGTSGKTSSFTQFTNKMNNNDEMIKHWILPAILAGVAGYELYRAFVEWPNDGINELMSSVDANEDAAHPAEYPWNHKGTLESYDAKSVRRGYQVYREICSACHGLNELAFRQLDQAFTEKEIKVLASAVDVTDGPDDKGNMYQRPAKPFDYMKGPYKNDAEARYVNGGALPPNLGQIIKARPYGEDYIFSLLTGYDEPPAGFDLRPGLYFNAYYNGGGIAMAPPLVDGALEYEDGTPATMSQMAKDVTTFLTYAAMPEQDERKKNGVKSIATAFMFLGLAYYTKRFKWNVIKQKKIVFKE